MKYFKKNDNSSGASSRHSKASEAISLGWLVPVFWALMIAFVVIGVIKATQVLLAQPVTRVVANGEFHHVVKRSIVDEVTPFLSEGFVRLDLDGIRSKLMLRPWVYDVAISRQWPNEIVIDVIEQIPIARWGSSGFLNHRGDLFQSDESSGQEFAVDLPLLIGPEESADKLMAHFREWHSVLEEKELNIFHLTLDEGTGWSAVIGNSISNNRVAVVLGRDDVMEKMQRFTAVYDLVLLKKFHQIVRIDMRYNNGLAVLWKEAAQMLEKKNSKESRITQMKDVGLVQGSNFGSVC